MAIGTVNTGASAADLESIRKSADDAKEKADEALDKITDITNVIQSLPVQSSILTYNGQKQEPEWSGYNPEVMEIEGYEARTEAGSYEVTFTPKEDYRWWDGETGGKTAYWTIARQPVSTPSQSNTLTYNGAEQQPEWDSLDEGKLSVGGVLAGTDAGDYYAEFTPADNYCFADGQAATKRVKWSIGRAAGSLELSKSAVTLSGGVTTTTVTAAVLGDGIVTTEIDHEEIATVIVGEDNKTVTITAVKTGTANITVHAAAGTNYDAPADKNLAVTVKVPSRVLAENTPEVIRETAQAGQAANYWKVGDRIGIGLYGTVGSLTLGGTYYAFIIGFDHNSGIEGKNTVHFQFGQDANGRNIAFVDGYYNSSTAGTAFCMNTYETNSDGWSASYMRNNICSKLLTAMPQTWQNVIAGCIKYSDNSGGSDSPGKVTSTYDKIWLLSEFEVQGKRTYANSAEQSYQKQYEYYQNGNNKIKYRHSNVGYACSWWTRSLQTGGSYGFCYVTEAGGVGYNNPMKSYGFAPGFKVA